MGRAVTAGELLRELEADPEWVAARDARDRDARDQEEQFRREQQPLVADLAAAGVVVQSAWDLLNSPGPYPAALPILMFHLSRPYSERVLEGIARALAVKEARPIAWDELLALLKSGTLPPEAANAAMVAISAMARPSDLPVLVALIREPSLGARRVFLVRNLMRSKRPEARATLLQLRDDPDLRIEIAARLRASRV